MRGEEDSSGSLAAPAMASHPPTCCRTHSFGLRHTSAHSIPVPAAGHTSAQDYQISSLRFGSPKQGLCVVAASELGHLDGAIVRSTQPCFVTVANENASEATTGAAPSRLLPSHSLSSCPSTNAYVQSHSLSVSLPLFRSPPHEHTHSILVPVVNCSWRGGRLTPAG